MFADVTNASKSALADLIGHLRRHEVEMIDCHQNMSHLAPLGGREIARKAFTAHVRTVTIQVPVPWQFDKQALLEVLPYGLPGEQAR